MRNWHVTSHSCVSFLHAYLAYQIERHIFKNPDVHSRFFSHRFSTECMHIRYRYEQSGVAEQSDANDRLRRALENQFHSGFTENIENTVTDYVCMSVYRCVVRMIGDETFCQKRLRIVR